MMNVNIDAVTVGAVAFISGIGQILAREMVDLIKLWRKRATEIIDKKKNGKK